MPRKVATDALSLFDTLVYTCEYRLVIDPTSTAMARVMEWKQLLRERIGKFEGAQQMPGIVLMRTELPPEYEGPLADAIARGASGFLPFGLSLSGLAHTEDRKTIYVNVLERGTVAALRQRILDNVRANRRIKKLGVDVAEHAMLPIATGLKVAQFNTAWAALAPFGFTTQQRVSDVVLMKREIADDSLDEHLRTFPLEPAR